MINFYVIQIRDLKTMTIEDVPKTMEKKVKRKIGEGGQNRGSFLYTKESEEQ